MTSTEKVIQIQLFREYFLQLGALITRANRTNITELLRSHNMMSATSVSQHTGATKVIYHRRSSRAPMKFTLKLNN